MDTVIEVPIAQKAPPVLLADTGIWFDTVAVIAIVIRYALRTGLAAPAILATATYIYICPCRQTHSAPDSGNSVEGNRVMREARLTHIRGK